MCKNLFDFTIRLECIIWAFVEIVLCVAFIVLRCFERSFGLYNYILLVALSFGILAGFCLLLGAILRNRFLVLAWIALICPVDVVVFVIYFLILHKMSFSYDMTRKTVGMILIMSWIVYLIYLSRLLIIEIKTGERQRRYPDCVGGHYPRGVLHERRRSNSQTN